MNLQQLRYFHKIAALKNYTKASEELFVAQSSLSHSMAKLEHELGVPLFIKQGRNIVVTSYGENFDKHVAIILRELELAKNENLLLQNQRGKQAADSSARFRT